MKPNKRALFVASQKGGPGKTTFARSLLDYYRRHQLVCAAYDADGEVGQLLQYYGVRDANAQLLEQQDPLAGCGYFDIRSESQRDTLLNVLDAGHERLLFDLPGGVVHELAKIVDTDGRWTGLVEAYARYDYRVTLILLLTPVVAALRTLSDALEMFGSRVDYVAVKNLAAAEESDFLLFDGFVDGEGKPRGGKGKKKLLELGGKIISMPRLSGRSYAQLDLYSLRFMDADHDKRLLLADRSRIFQWRQAMDQQLEKARAELALAALQPEKKAAAAS